MISVVREEFPVSKCKGIIEKKITSLLYFFPHSSVNIGGLSNFFGMNEL
jgi:hypothetical protein